MSQTPLVDSLGLKVYRFLKSPNVRPRDCGELENPDWVGVSINDLERLLEGCPIYYGYENRWESIPSKIDTHTARLICVSEIKKEPLKEVIETSVRPYDNALFTGVDLIHKFKGKKVRVTVEEIL